MVARSSRTSHHEEEPMSAPEPTEGRPPTEPLHDAVPVSQMAGLGYDALEQRLRELRGSLGLPDAPPRSPAPTP